MSTLLWAGLAANALVHLRFAVLQVQDGEDRVKAGEATPKTVVCWRKDGYGVTYVVLRTLASPILTAYKVSKFLLFPRGVKSQFAKEQETKAWEKFFMETEEANLKAEEEKQAQLQAQTKELEALILTWAPGEVLLATPQPEQVALGWHAAADVFDAAADHVARTKGEPWRTNFDQIVIKARVGA